MYTILCPKYPRFFSAICKITDLKRSFGVTDLTQLDEETQTLQKTKALTLFSQWRSRPCSELLCRSVLSANDTHTQRTEQEYEESQEEIRCRDNVNSPWWCRSRLRPSQYLCSVCQLAGDLEKDTAYLNNDIIMCLKITNYKYNF